MAALDVDVVTIYPPAVVDCLVEGGSSSVALPGCLLAPSFLSCHAAFVGGRNKGFRVPGPSPNQCTVTYKYFTSVSAGGKRRGGDLYLTLVVCDPGRALPLKHAPEGEGVRAFSPSLSSSSTRKKRKRGKDVQIQEICNAEREVDFEAALRDGILVCKEYDLCLPLCPWLFLLFFLFFLFSFFLFRVPLLAPPRKKITRPFPASRRSRRPIIPTREFRFQCTTRLRDRPQLGRITAVSSGVNVVPN